MSWTIDEGRAEDAAVIARFQVEMALESEGTELNLETVLKGVAAGLDDPYKGKYFVARGKEGSPVGSLFLTKEWSDWNNTWYWWIQSVYVQPEFRRQGIFSALYKEVERRAREEGVTSIKLYVDRENERAQKCYQKQGMKESHYLLYEI